MRHTLGVAVFSGMLGVTIFGVFLTPVFFCAIDWLGARSVFQSRRAKLISKAAMIVMTSSIFPPILLIHLIRYLVPRKAPPGPRNPTDPI